MPLAVLCILAGFGIVSLPRGLLAPFVGLATGLMFSTLALLITSFVRTINHFNFYFTGIISPMFFFSGVVFPVSNLPAFVRPVAQVLPLTHSVRLVRAVCTGMYRPGLLVDLLYVVAFILIV